MKNKIKLMLVVLLSFSLFACTSLSEQGIKEFEKVKKAMRKNDSFKLTIDAVYLLDNKMYGSSSGGFYQLNDFYSKNKEGYIAFGESAKDIKSLYLKNNQKYVENTNGQILRNDEEASFEFEFEFLKLEQRFIKRATVKEKNDEVTMSIELDLKSAENRSIYFNGSKDIEFPDYVNRGHVEFTLNKNYTIKKCRSTYFTETKEGLLESTAVIIFLNYGPQDIQFPEGMENI